ncbi:MAG: tRNA (adenosine(37)-N6)-threonylcarbamoyltransferase complex dimerization subunit type 1 TsaB, partial [Bacteroidetes bacterium]
KDLFLHKENIKYLAGVNASAKNMGEISEQKFLNKDFEDVALFEPFYLKDFIAGKPKVKGLY